MSQYTYKLGNETYEIPSDAERDMFLSLNPNAELISSTPDISLETAQDENTYPYYIKDENVDLGYSEFNVPASKIKEFELRYPDASHTMPKYVYDFDADAFYSEEFKGKSMGLTERFASRLIQGVLPVPIKDVVPPPETWGEKATDFAGGGVGMMAGFGLFKVLVGGVQTLYKGTSKATNKIFKRYTNLMNKGKDKAAKKLLDKEIKKGTFVTKAGESLVPTATGALGHSKKYAEMISSLAANHPKSAAALNEFISNGLAFGAHGQFKSHLPLWDLTERSKQFVNDSIMGSMFTLAGAPQFLELSKIAQHAVSAPMLFGIGFGSDKAMPFSPGGEPQEMTLTDRFTHGFGMLSLYYGHKGLNSYQIKQKQKQALRALGMPEAEVTKFMKENANVAEQAVKMTVKVRDPEFQEPYVNKKDSSKRVDVLRIDREKGKVPKVTYQEMGSKNIKTMPLKGFTQRYQRAKDLGEQDVFSVKVGKRGKQHTVTQQDKRGNRVGPVEKFKSQSAANDRVTEIDINIKENAEKHRNAQIAAKTKESALLMSNKDAKYIKEALFPESEGSTVNMGVKELHYYNKVLSKSIRASAAERPNLAYLETAVDREGVLGAFDAVNRSLVIDPVTYLRNIGKKSPTAKELSYKIENFRDIHDLELGSYSLLQLKLENLKLSKKQIDTLFGEIDPYFKDYVTAEIKNPDIRATAIDLIKQTLAKTVDKAVAYGVSVKVMDKGGRSRVEPMWAAFDAKGKLIDIDVETTVGSMGKKGRQQRGIQFLEVGDNVKTLEGKNKKIAEIRYNHIQENYMHRIITKEARDLFGVNAAYQKFIIDKMSRFDSDAVRMREKRIELETKARNTKSNKKKRQYEEEALQYSEAEIELTMNEKFSKVSGYIDDVGIYGNQYSRVKSEIPPEIALDINGKVIELKKFNTHKKGDIVDNRRIDRIVKIYETNLSDVLARYGNKMSHVLAVTGTYGADALTPEGKVKGSPGVKGVIAQELINSVARETNSPKLGKYVESLLRNQIHGTSIEQEAADYTIKTFNATIGAVSNAALSAPTAGLKNLMLGQGSNATIFGLRATGRAMKEISTPEGWRTALEQATSVGAVESGVRLLETQKLLRYNPGGMYISELTNRMVAVSAGRISAVEALNVLNGKTSPLTVNMSRASAEHLLFKTFDLQNMPEIVKRGHFTAKEMEKIQQRASRVSQGQAVIEYMPTAYQSKFMRPFTLFHRMAYRATNTMYKNAIVPAGRGIVWPLMKFATAAYATGAAKEYIYYLASGAPERDMFQTVPTQILNTALTGEVLLQFSNLLDDRGPMYFPAVLDYWNKTGDLAAYYMSAATTGLGGEIAELLATVDKLDVPPQDKERIKQEGYKRIFSGLMAESADYVKKQIPGANMLVNASNRWAGAAEPYKLEAEYVSKLQNAYADAKNINELKVSYDGRVYNAETEFTKELQNLFWAGSKGEQRRLYEAAVLLKANNELINNPDSATFESAVTQAIKDVEKKIIATSPTYSTSKKKFKGGVPLVRSQYQAFLKSLNEVSPEDVPRVIAAQKDWDIRKALWDDTIEIVSYNIRKYGYNIDYAKHYGVPDPASSKSIYEDPAASREMFE